MTYSYILPSRAALLMLLTILLSGDTTSSSNRRILIVQADESMTITPSARPSATTTTTTTTSPSETPSETPSTSSYYSMNPSPSPTVFVPTVSATPSETPSFSPTHSPSMTGLPTSNPTDSDDDIALKEKCQNTRGWSAPATFMQNGQWVHGVFDCDHPSISCQRTARMGPASEHCCKCQPECCGKCHQSVYYKPSATFSGDPCAPNGTSGDFGGNNDYPNNNNNNNGGWGLGNDNVEEEEDDSSGPIEGLDMLRFIFSAMGITFCVIAGLLVIRNQQSRELRDARRLMAERRRMQREREEADGNNNNGNGGESRPQDMNARYEQIVTAFLFQNVNSDKTNISAASIRGEKGAAASSRTLENRGGDDEAPPPRTNDLSTEEEEEEEDPTNKTAENSLLPTSWYSKSAPTDECCICLDDYCSGETICVPITKECNHVFHEECIVEWLKNHTECPLCRIKILGGD